MSENRPTPEQAASPQTEYSPAGAHRSWKERAIRGTFRVIGAAHYALAGYEALQAKVAASSADWPTFISSATEIAGKVVETAKSGVVDLGLIQDVLETTSRPECVAIAAGTLVATCLVAGTAHLLAPEMADKIKQMRERDNQ